MLKWLAVILKGDLKTSTHPGVVGATGTVGRGVDVSTTGVAVGSGVGGRVGTAVGVQVGVGVRVGVEVGRGVGVAVGGTGVSVGLVGLAVTEESGVVVEVCVSVETAISAGTALSGAARRDIPDTPIVPNEHSHKQRKARMGRVWRRSQ